MSTSAFRTGLPLPGRDGRDAEPSAPRSSASGEPARVPRQFVHRSSAAEVMIMDWARTGDDRFTVTARWPHDHPFFTPVAGGYHDPLLGCETIRQTGILLGHAAYGVPLGHQFVVWDLDITVHPEKMATGRGPGPTVLTADAHCTQIHWRGRNLAGLRLSMDIRRDGETVATGGGSLSCISPAAYHRVRQGRLPSRDHALPPRPADPRAVGRVSPHDVVLSPTDRTDHWLLRADTRHPVLFEHPGDHVPGMLLIEAARQATAASLGRASYLPLRITNTFARYVELDTPCTVQATPLPDAQSVLVTAHQSGEPVFRSTISAGTHHL
ncbi:ScbA/BarX family gamma-butyrolactone biosynthesis protein [Streptomyces sp. NPDC001108]